MGDEFRCSRKETNKNRLHVARNGNTDKISPDPRRCLPGRDPAAFKASTLRGKRTGEAEGHLMAVLAAEAVTTLWDPVAGEREVAPRPVREGKVRGDTLNADIVAFPPAAATTLWPRLSPL